MNVLRDLRRDAGLTQREFANLIETPVNTFRMWDCAMRNGLCRLHGGLSTGPKTQAGIDRCQRAATKHGRYSREARIERRRLPDVIEECRAALRRLS